MITKRVIYSWRNRVLTISQLLVPVFFAIMSCWVIKVIASRSDEDPPPRDLTLTMFKDPMTSHLSNISSASNMGARIRNAFTHVAKKTSTVEEVSDAKYIDNFDMDGFLSDKSEADPETYFQSYMAAATFRDSNLGADVVTWFNNEAVHSSAIALNMMGNALLQYFTGTTQYSINAINHPLPLLNSSKSEQAIYVSTTSGFIVAYNLTFAMAFLIGTFVVFLIKERIVKAKHSQFVSGVHVFNFWMSTFIWDIINYLIPSLAVICVLAAFNIEAYIEGQNAG